MEAERIPQKDEISCGWQEEGLGHPEGYPSPMHSLRLPTTPGRHGLDYLYLFALFGHLEAADVDEASVAERTLQALQTGVVGLYGVAVS